MKILLTTSFYPPCHLGGDAVHVKHLAEALARRGHEVHVLFSRDAFDLKRPQKKVHSPASDGVIIHELRSPIRKFEPILNYVLGTQRYTLDYFSRLVKKEDFDVVHHHNISLLGYNLLEKKGRYKNIYTAHDYWLICAKYDYFKDGKQCESFDCLRCCIAHRKPYPIYRTGKRYERALKDIDTVIAPSMFMKEIMSRHFTNVLHLYNFMPEPHKLAGRKGDYFVYVGALDRLKGVLNMVEAFQGSGQKLKIIGTGPLEKDLRDLGAKDIEVLGWQEPAAVMKTVSGAKAMIIPSIWPENNPFVSIEAYALGVPVIASSAGGLPEVVSMVDKKLIFNSIDELRLMIRKFKGIDRDRPIAAFKKNFTEKAFMDRYMKMLE
jgi:glycosyltransferase involved in cell wall biosynthesis